MSEKYLHKSQKWTAFELDGTYCHQTFTEWVFSQYTHFVYIDMPDATASYGTPFDCIAFFGYFHTLFCLNCCISTNLHVWSAISSRNIYKLCIWYEWKKWIKKIVIIKCQMWVHVMERSLILLCFFGIFIHYWRPSIKHSQIVYLINTHTLICWHARCIYKLQ